MAPTAKNQISDTSALRVGVFFCYKQSFEFKNCKNYLQNNSKRIKKSLSISLQKDVNVSKHNFCNTIIKQLHLSKHAYSKGSA